MRELVKAGVDVHVCVPDAEGLVPQYREAMVSVHVADIGISTRYPWRIQGSVDRLRSIVAEVEPEVVHSHFVATTLSMRLALRWHHTPRRIFQVPGPLHLENPVFRTLEIRSATADDYWIASCRWTRGRYIQSGISPERVYLSIYGGEVGNIRPGPGGKLRQELGVGVETRIIGMVAFMYAPKRYLGQRRGIKGHEDLIDAYAIVRKTIPNSVCVCVGGAWGGADGYENKVRAYARKRCGDGVFFLGTRPDVHELYDDFDVAVHPSHSENLGGAGESLLHEIPTIASAVGGLPDLVIHGETGWLVPPKSPSRLAEAICEALLSPEEGKRRAARGRALVEKECDIKKTSREVLDIYTDILRTYSTGKAVASL